MIDSAASSHRATVCRLRRPAGIWRFAWVAALSVGLLSACSDEDVPVGDEITNQDGDAALSDLDALMDGAPDNSKLPDEGKADGVYPDAFADLVAQQSPVQSQGRRGVCSIFGAVALMEHLYIAEGTILIPDFSEQFLQWSTKRELGSFTNTSGSNARVNLRAINRKGIVVESDWPYEISQWDEADDPECGGDDPLPTKCYTNGEPPDAALAATRWHLPAGRWISSRPNSIKAHMVGQQQGVVVGMTFFYQSWNHRKSELPTSNAYWRKGYVTYPNDEDKDKSLEKRAGHGFLLVGWDDTLEVQKRDGQGDMLTDDEGNPITEKGFFIFKNSWGTGSFGVENPHGDGYGYISMQYVEDYATAYVSGLPELEFEEICNDGEDNDYDLAIDCDDDECADDEACQGATRLYANDEEQSIPDNDAEGIVSEIVVDDGGTISALAVTVDITHTYRGDLTVKLVRDGGGEVVLHERQGGSEDNLQQTYPVVDFLGEDAAGTWRLEVTDRAGYDTGSLNSWGLEITTDGVSQTHTYESIEQVLIPDNDPTGVFTNIEVSGDNRQVTIAALQLRVTIDHPYQGDLTLKLQRVGVPGEVILQEADAASGDFGTKSYVVNDYVGDAAEGLWRLTVTDEAQYDEGTLQSWSLEITGS